MNTTLIAIIGAMALAAPAMADPGGWEIDDKTSSLDGAQSFFAFIKADEAIANLIDRMEEPRLGISCDSKGVFATLLWPDFIEAEYDTYKVQVTWKLDDGPIQHSKWSATTQSVGLAGKGAVAWMNQVAHGHKLMVRVPDKHGG